jgi:pimeloyl-ACP methyl ester carboxylesterase
MNVAFTQDKDSLKATMDIPQQNAKNLPLLNVKFNDPSVYFELGSRIGVAKYDGKLIKDTIKGKFTQNVVEGTFTLYRINPKDTVTERLPYKVESVTFSNGENTFGATLTSPLTPGRHPVIVLIAGSGAHNRDEEILGYKPFKMIANHLTRQGFAVLRYDKRGVGESKGKTTAESTTMDFATDVEQAVKMLKTRNDVDTTKIGLLGHSEGGIIAPLVASRNKDIAFIILMAGTGIKGSDVMLEQKKLIMEKSGAKESNIKKSLQSSKDIFEAIRKNKGFDKIRKEIKEEILANYPKDTSKAFSKAEQDSFINLMVEQQMKPIQSNWFKYFLEYDPVPALEKVTCPVLVLFGEMDVQVSPQQNQKPIVDALKKAGNKDVTVRVFPKANHLFLTAITGNIDEYRTLDKVFVPGFLATISEWARKRCGLSN